jgi:hypothetical protein
VAALADGAQPRRALLLHRHVKNGAVWAKGDALYYALNMDHFYRFYPQEVSSVVGT